MMDKKKNKIISFLYLIRLNNTLIAVLSLIVAIYIGNNQFETSKLILAILSIFFISSGGNIINDYFDIETDRVNKPNRPLISNKFNLKNIFLLSILLLFIGVIFSLFIDRITFIISLIASILLFLYSRYFKRIAIIGNFIVAFLSGLLFLYGALISHNLNGGIFPAIFAFLITFGRELTKDIEDIEGDRAAGMKTLPILIGEKKTFLIACFFFFLLIISTFVPYFIGLYNKWYFFISVFCVDIVLIILLIMFFVFDDIKTKRFVNNYIKYDMIVGLIAIIIGIKT